MGQPRRLSGAQAMRSYLFATAMAIALCVICPFGLFAAEVKAPVWTGFYIGANVGYGWSDPSVNFSPNDPTTTQLFAPNGAVVPGGFGLGGALAPISFNTSGALGGLQLGYNWQLVRNWVVGFETDFDWSDINGSGSTSGPITGFALPPAPAFAETVDERVEWFGTVRARLGYLPANNLLAYVTGGFAYGRVKHTGSYVNTGAGALSITGLPGGFGVHCAPGATCFAGSSSGTATGWTAGGGFEYALWNNFTLKAEYLYVSLESKSLTQTALAASIPGETPASFNANYGRTVINVARIGLNYHF
jgi:outer membrane immunogenic protein